MEKIKQYIKHCQAEKNLSENTVRAYKTDLVQYFCFCENNILNADRRSLTAYLSMLTDKYKVKTVKRKIATVKAFYNWLVYCGDLEWNPFLKMRVQLKEPFALPKVISIEKIDLILHYAYEQLSLEQKNTYKYFCALRNVLIIEILFLTGLRVAELSNLKYDDMIDYCETFLINGKGSKERIVHISNEKVKKLLEEHIRLNNKEIITSGFIFTNNRGSRFSEQSIRNMISAYVLAAGIKTRITPHMYRHSFATCLLDEGVDIRYIQALLGHSSIKTTEIYTAVTFTKQKNLLTEKHPRNKLNI